MLACLPGQPGLRGRPPREKRALEDFGYLSEVELTLLFRAVPEDGAEPAPARPGTAGAPRAARVADGGARAGQRGRPPTPWRQIRRCSSGARACDRLAYLRPDVAAALDVYLTIRGPVVVDARGTPALYGGGELRRRGATGAPRDPQDGRRLPAPDGRQASRRPPPRLYVTGGDAPAYRYSHDLRAVQEMLGQPGPEVRRRATPG